MEIKERIIEGATDLFKNYGIRSVTMDSLASQLGISKRTIYEVFTDKDQLVTEVLKAMAKKHEELIKRILNESENSIAAIFRLLEINREFTREMSPVFQSDLKKYSHSFMRKEVGPDITDYRKNQKVIEKGIEEELFRNDINPDLVNRCLFNLGMSVMDNDLYPFEEFSRREVVRNVFINYLKGISTRQGLEMINKLEVDF